MTGQADTARDLRLKLWHAEELARAATQACEEAGTLLETTLQNGLEAGLECDIEATEHRREHRPGRAPGRAPGIDTDPALEAFIRSRLDKLTFVEIAADVAALSRPERRIGKSAIHAWWVRTRDGS